MDATDPVLTLGNEGSVEPLEFGIQVLYENLEAGLRAGRTLNRTLQALGTVVNARVNFCRLDLFPKLSFLESSATLEIDLVFLSMRGLGPLPDGIMRWFHEWFGLRTDDPRALALILEEGVAAAPGAVELIEGLAGPARSGGVDVFLPPEAEWESAVTAIRTRAETTTVLLDEVLHHLAPASSVRRRINQ